MLTKDFKASFRTVKDAKGKATGEVTAVVSAFGNVDTVGDRVVKGAFGASLQGWKDSGDPIPMLWSHDWSDPMSHIGAWDAAKAVETDEGLELTGLVDIGTGNPVADQAYKLMAGRLVREFSFAYEVVNETKGTDGANDLLELDLIEAGPTLKGANSATRLVAAKAMDDAYGAKVGRAISAKNEAALLEAVDGIDAGIKSIKVVLKSLTSGADGSKDAGLCNDPAHLEGKAPGDMPAEPPADAPADEAPEPEGGPVALDPALLAALEDAEIELVLGLSAPDAEDDAEATPADAPVNDVPVTV